MCTALPAPDNGDIQYSLDTTAPFVYKTVATYSCNEGFGPVGETERLCGRPDPNAGEWSGSGATCEGQYSANAVFSETSHKKLLYFCIYSCLHVGCIYRHH